eukprot:scpid101668/ scgid6896/ 
MVERLCLNASAIFLNVGFLQIYAACTPVKHRIAAENTKTKPKESKPRYFCTQSKFLIHSCLFLKILKWGEAHFHPCCSQIQQLNFIITVPTGLFVVCTLMHSCSVVTAQSPARGSLSERDVLAVMDLRVLA